MAIDTALQQIISVILILSFAESAASLFRQLARSGSDVGCRSSPSESGGLQTSNHLLRSNLLNDVRSSV